jgi:hypothetical protein
MGRSTVVRGGRRIRQLLWYIDRTGQTQISLPSLAYYYYLKLRKNARQDATSSLFNRLTRHSGLASFTSPIIKPLPREWENAPELRSRRDMFKINFIKRVYYDMRNND